MTLAKTLSTIVSNKNILLANSDKYYSSLDQSNGLEKCLPLMVVKVFSQQELIDSVQACISFKTPLVIRAAGTGKTGGAIADKNSVVIDICGLNRIISIDTKNLFAEVEPGVVLSQFKSVVKQQGLFYPPNPASMNQCTLGGNVALNAAGPSTLKYGSTRNYFLGGQAILGTGEIITFGQHAPKGCSGYDLASLLCGSEGTLAVFTQLRLRLLPLPKDMHAVICYFHAEADALMAVNRILIHGHLPRTLEYIDSTCLDALKKFGVKNIEQAGAALIIECDAAFEGGAKIEIQEIVNLLKPPLTVQVPQENRAALWHTRSLLSDASAKYLGHKISEDVAVPIGRLKDLRNEVKALAQPPHLILGLFGHAGDGNLHIQIMFDNPHQSDLAQQICQKIMSLVVRLGGTIAAEHGIGLKKKAYLPFVQDPAALYVQKQIKKAFDPHNLLNPGKIFDV